MFPLSSLNSVCIHRAYFEGYYSPNRLSFPTAITNEIGLAIHFGVITSPTEFNIQLCSDGICCSLNHGIYLVIVVVVWLGSLESHLMRLSMDCIESFI